MKDLDRFKANLLLFSAGERSVLLGWVEAGGNVALIERLAAARRRAVLRRDSDAVTDGARRTLVGARVPRELADRVRTMAKARGVSLYRFMLDMLERECHN